MCIGLVAHLDAIGVDLTEGTSYSPSSLGCTLLLGHASAFEPCEHHGSACYGSVSRYRRAEVILEGGVKGRPGHRVPIRSADMRTGHRLLARPISWLDMPRTPPEGLRFRCVRRQGARRRSSKPAQAESRNPTQRQSEQVMTSRSGRHVTAPQITLYKPSMPGWARHRKPNRRQLAWHLDNLAATASLRIAERAMRGRS